MHSNTGPSITASLGTGLRQSRSKSNSCARTFLGGLFLRLRLLLSSSFLSRAESLAEGDPSLEEVVEMKSIFQLLEASVSKPTSSPFVVATVLLDLLDLLDPLLELFSSFSKEEAGTTLLDLLDPFLSPFSSFSNLLDLLDRLLLILSS